MKPSRSFLQDSLFRLKQRPLAWVSFSIILVYFGIAGICLLGGFSAYNVSQPELVYEAPSSQHWLGTDIFGRDVLSRAAHGTLTSLTVGLIGAGIAMFIGTLLGSLAGYFGGKTDELIVWFYTTVDTVPYILLVVAFSFIMGPSIKTLCLAVGLTFWVGHCRVMRSEFMKHRDRDYVQGASAIGASHLRRLLHIFPNVGHLILINFSLGFVSVVKSEVILSYLGLGVEAGAPSWGVMINDARLELARGVWWNLAAAALFMFFLVLSFNLFTDALRDALDPKLKNK